jgi:hypothetical protein
MSLAGFCVGNIRITTNGQKILVVSADGSVRQGPNEVAAAGLPRSFTIDDQPLDASAPTTSVTAPVEGAVVSLVTTVMAVASDDVGVVKVEFCIDGGLMSVDTSSPYSWSWDTTVVPNGVHSVSSKAYDAAGNVGPSTPVRVTVTNVPSAGRRRSVRH